MNLVRAVTQGSAWCRVGPAPNSAHNAVVATAPGAQRELSVFPLARRAVILVQMSGYIPVGIRVTAPARWFEGVLARAWTLMADFRSWEAPACSPRRYHVPMTIRASNGRIAAPLIEQQHSGDGAARSATASPPTT
jgi:hypothetical protein